MDVVFPKPGKYVVAVSGGVDSVVLLDILSQRNELSLTVAHFDHGIRPDSAEDRKLVNKLAEDYGLPFVYEKANLGKSASEATAREARYNFLNQVVNENDATAIITAHHQNDLLETAILNMLRGTGRKGLTALANNSQILRPLLNVPKQDLIKYARDRDLEWREDSTNQDTAYLRNYIRHEILPQFNEVNKKTLLSNINNLRAANQQADQLLDNILENELADDKLKRSFFIQLPHSLAKEFMASWLRHNGIRDFDKEALERLVIGGKTAAPGKQVEAVKGYKLIVTKDYLALRGPER